MKSKWTEAQLSQMNVLKEHLERCRELCKACGCIRFEVTSFDGDRPYVQLENQIFFALFDQYKSQKLRDSFLCMAVWKGIEFVTSVPERKAPAELVLEQGANARSNKTVYSNSIY